MAVCSKITYIKSIHKNTCFIPTKQFKKYELRSQIDHITLTTGALSFNSIKLVKEDILAPNQLCFSEDLKDILKIPENTILQVRNIEDNHIEIGPLIGVFISSEKVAHLKDGYTDNVYEHISKTSKILNGLCYFFSLDDIDWDNKLVDASLPNGSIWVRHKLPLPKVIYDRCFGEDGREKSMNLRSKLDDRYKVINSTPELSKWDTIQALAKNPDLADHVPETVLYRSEHEIKHILNKYPRVYLKPNLLNKGKGVCRFSCKGKGIYVLEYRSDGKNKVKKMSNLRELDMLIDDYAAQGGGYLIQSEIKKACYENDPFDFRLLFQKDWKGKWQQSGIAVRIGAPGSIITSPRSGGKVEELNTILKEVFNEDESVEDGIYNQITTIGRKVAETIELEFGDCVELGLDMTIDVYGKVWIIDVNGKPLKVSLKRLNNTDIINQAYNRPIEYAVYLTEFESRDTCKK